MASLFGLDPNDPSILSILGASLRDAGAGYGGRQSDALPQLLATQRKAKQYQDLQNALAQQPTAPGLPGVDITPNQITGQGGGMTVPPVAAGGMEGAGLGLPPQLAQLLPSLPQDVGMQLLLSRLTKENTPIKLGKDEQLRDFNDPSKVLATNTAPPKWSEPKPYTAADGHQVLLQQDDQGNLREAQGGYSPAAPLKTQAQIDQEIQVRKAGRQPVQPSVDRDVLLPVLQKLQRGETLTTGEQNIIATLKPNAAISGASGASPLGIVGSPDIDPTAEGYSNSVVGNTGITQAAIDQRALNHITAGTNPPIGRTGVAGLQNAAVSNRMAEMDPGGNLAAHKTEIKAFGQSLATQQKYLDNTQRALNTANDTFDSLQSYMTENGVNPNQFPDFNRFSNFLKAKGVDPGTAGGYTAQLATLRAEYSQVLAKGGVRSVETDREAAKLIPDGLAPKDLAKVAAQIKVDADNVVRDSQQQIVKLNGQINNIRKSGTTGAQAPGESAPPPRAAASQSGGIPVMSTPEDAMKLPPGTVFKTPDGRTKVR